MSIARLVFYALAFAAVAASSAYFFASVGNSDGGGSGALPGDNPDGRQLQSPLKLPGGEEVIAESMSPSTAGSLHAASSFAVTQCPAVVKASGTEYEVTMAAVGDVRKPPRFHMPWHYSDPNPLCGRPMLRWLHGGQPLFVHALAVDQPGNAELRRNTLQRSDGTPRSKSSLFAIAGQENSLVTIEQCGTCTTSAVGCAKDILITARLHGPAGYLAAEVVPLLPLRAGRHVVRFTALDPGEYNLEVKLVHVNGSSDNPSYPRSLGVVGIRAFDGRKTFKYNSACDLQRHVVGSPIAVVVASPTRTYPPLPFCNTGDVAVGRWVRFSKGMCNSRKNAFCYGDPSWLTDACAYNTDFLWAPAQCKYRYWTPPRGPTASCMASNKRAVFLLIGDSVTREYGMNCRLFDFKEANLVCVFNNIALEGKHFSRDYATAVAKTIVDGVVAQNAGAFATNLGIHHMIGTCTTAQWTEFVSIFADLWIKRVRFSTLADAAFRGNTSLAEPQSGVLLEKAIWIGPPTIHYANLGMGYQRAAKWDMIAWDLLKLLGFRRLYAIAPTKSRQEGSWDGLHYASQRNKVQSAWRNRHVPVSEWNGGVANMLFTILLNVVCPTAAETENSK